MARPLLAGYSLGVPADGVFEPVDLFECGLFHGIEAAPWLTTVNDLGPEKIADRLGQSSVVALASASVFAFNEANHCYRDRFQRLTKRRT